MSVKNEESCEVVDIVIYDLSTLRFRRSARKTSMSVIAASGEVLAVVDTLAVDSNEDAAYAACEHALATARVRREGTWCRIGLYNPYSGETSYRPAPDSIVFGAQQPVAIETLGSRGKVEGGEGSERLHLNGLLLERQEPSVAAASRAWDSTGERNRR